jgi:UDP-3-O-[3-hydroxymyristoyl] N-acetylglucosamine deacetylase
MRDQATIANPVRVSGVGLHTGRHATVVLHPASAGNGITIHRTDAGSVFPATSDEAGRLDWATRLGPSDGDVQTVEHLLSAAFGLGVDNILVEIDGPEVPALDGSALPWVQAIRAAGIVRQGSPIRPIRLSRTLVVPAGPGKHLEIRPASDFRVTYTIDFPHRAVGRQSVTFVVSPETYARHVAPARTFGFLSEYEQLKAHGLARGANMENCLVIGDDRVENGPLRFADEFVRHKALDLIGDLSLVGRPVLGHVVAHRASHALHGALARLLREESAADELPFLGAAPAVALHASN